MLHLQPSEHPPLLRISETNCSSKFKFSKSSQVEKQKFHVLLEKSYFVHLCTKCLENIIHFRCNNLNFFSVVAGEYWEKLYKDCL